MSTPTTATATLHHYNPHHLPSFSHQHQQHHHHHHHHHHQPPYSLANPPPPLSSLLSTTSRLVYPVGGATTTTTTTTGNSARPQPAPASGLPSNGLNLSLSIPNSAAPSATRTRLLSGRPPALAPADTGLTVVLRDYNLDYDGDASPVSPATAAAASVATPSSAVTAVTTTTTTATTVPAATMSATAVDSHPPRKRRRSREPDWNDFYKNGLPKEIIIIDDDTPEPHIVPLTHKMSDPNRHLLPPDAIAATGPSSAHGSDGRPPAKKRKWDDDIPSVHYNPVHLHLSFTVNSQTGTPSCHDTKSRVSTAGSGSAVQTTAATSLGSQSSNGQQHYIAHVQQPEHVADVQPGQKRKRTTRQQLAIEAKRREAGAFPDAFTSYQPPPQPPKKASDVHVKVIADNTYRHTPVDDSDGHYIVVPDRDLTDRYQMIKLLGQGTFGKVVQARDRKRNKLVAIKIIRSVQKYRDASKIELRVLATLKANDVDNRNRCIHLRDCFDFQGHICIVMDLLGQSVFDFLKGNNFTPFPNSQIQNFARQLFTSVAFLHDLNLIHTDLKPENILLCNSEYQTFTYNRKIPSSSHNISRQATQRRVLLDTEIRLIDFGSATFDDEYHSSVVSTRHYRAPEIILGLGWSFPCDIWSIGCILVEFYTGDALFQTHDNLEHLAMMESVVDTRIDNYLVTQVTRASRNGGNPAAKYFKRLRLDYPTPDTTRASRRFVKAMKKIDEIIPANSKFMKEFRDLLKKIFSYDPARRITARQALQHPWFKEMPQADDGSEAARLRLERPRMLSGEHGNRAAAASHRV